MTPPRSPELQPIIDRFDEWCTKLTGDEDFSYAVAGFMDAYAAEQVARALAEERKILLSLAAWSIEGGCWCPDQHDGDLPMPQREEDHTLACRRTRAYLSGHPPEG